jgi:hypothetical protein
LFDFFGGGNEEEEQTPQTPIYRSIDPNGRYHSVCVRLCDGFFFPISYSTYSSHLAQDATTCQSSCAAPAELYVYRNPGGEIEQAISLNGAAYADLPNAFKYRKQYVKGCSCKETEYNPTEIEAGQRAEAEAAATGKPGKKPTKSAQAAPAAAPVAPAAAQAAAPAAPAAAADTAPASEAQQSSVAKQAATPQ